MRRGAGRTRYHDGRVGASELGFHVSCATHVSVQLGGSLAYFPFVSNLMVVFSLQVFPQLVSVAGAVCWAPFVVCLAFK